jgi:hypothetical protein
MTPEVSLSSRWTMPRHAADAGEAGAAMVQEGVDQGAVRRAGRGMGGHAGGLVDDDQVGVFEQHDERYRLGGGQGRRRRRHDQQVVAGQRLGRGVVDHHPIAAERALGHQGLQPGAGEVRPRGRQRLVQPPAGFVFAEGDQDRGIAQRLFIVRIVLRLDQGRSTSLPFSKTR